VVQAGSGEQAALGTSMAMYDYNSPDCPVVHRAVRRAVHRRTRRSRELINGVRLKFTGLSGEAPDCPVSQRSTGPMVGRAICVGHVAEPTARRRHWTVSSVHQTVPGAPTALRLQWSASPNKEGYLYQTVSGGAPDCLVRQSTEGKICLPGMFSMAPSCLGSIKGTPRRMEKNIKHTQSIPKHQDFDSTHLFLRDSI
jgi:hypothetical protein